MKNSSKICDEHFLTGKPGNLRIHPDYVPTIFPWNNVKKPTTNEEKMKLNEKLDAMEARVQECF